MRIVQTFWTAGRDPLKYSFGWTHPEYNLMSWALSCLSLREHYDEVALYTDQEGYDVLINKLHLPYTEVNVVYDKNLCLPQHWAYAKIKTYSMQTKPFIHVDGDVYLPKPIPEDIANAPLIAQNREIGTIYYKQMMDRLLSHPEIILPEYIRKGLAEQSLASYNMGFFGGSDLDFIRHYCQEVEDFLHTNSMNDYSRQCSRVNCNIFFEQIVMATMADIKGMKVASVYGKPVEDKGYLSREFCDFGNYENKKLFHVLGGHKRSPFNYEQLEKTVFRLYPEYFTRIINLFQDIHRRLGKPGYSNQKYKSVERSIAQFEDIRETKASEWDSLSNDVIIETDRTLLGSYDFCIASPEEREDFIINVHPYLFVYKIPNDWHPKASELMKQRLLCEKEFPLEGVCIFPTLLHDGIKEVPIVDLQQKIITFLNKAPIPYRELEAEIMNGFTLNSEKARNGARKLIYYEVSNIIKQGILIVNRYNY